ncbi:MAG: hypothetical protein KBA55_15610 [Ruminococcus sp.]|nr:hypothetical protein [Ruminococcus sp.]
MKRFTAAAAACVIIAGAFSGCSRKPAGSGAQVTSSSATTTQEETEQPDPLAVTETTTNVTSTTSGAASATTSTAVTSSAPKVTEQPDPLGGGAFSYDDNGAVVFDAPPADENDAVLMSAAQKLFESACKTYWSYMINCPYELDYNSYVENDFGWQYYKIVTPGITSFADVERDYGKVFSDRYPNDLATNYREHEGAVYAINGDRGAHLYYSASKITDIESRSADEIVFTVENYYDGSDFGDESYSETDTFSAVIDGDTWKVGKFTLPY